MMKSIEKRLEPLIDNEKTGHVSFVNYSLKDIKYLLKHFGNPHKRTKMIHIAGTNGKGSVAYMLNSILIASDLRVGLYTSPHLDRINERIKVNNKEISNQVLHRYTDELMDILDKKPDLRPTYFDALTLFAFRYYDEQDVDIAVIETGLGGRLDSTNVISPLISVITDISIDHKNVLGNTIREIASEKAGIIKKKKPVITSNSNRVALEVIANRAKECSSELFILNRDFRIKNIKSPNKNGNTAYDLHLKENLDETVSLDSFVIEDIELGVSGKFQLKNSSMAALTSILLKRQGFNINEESIRKGINSVSIPGRFFLISNNPLIIFDPAHNQNALKAIIESLKKDYPDKKFKVVLSFMMDKDYDKMLKIIMKTLTNEIYYYELNDKRCFRLSDNERKSRNFLYDNIRSFNRIEELGDVLIREMTDDSLLFITGSFRLWNIAKKLTSIIRKGLS